MNKKLVLSLIGFVTLLSVKAYEAVFSWWLVSSSPAGMELLLGVFFLLLFIPSILFSQPIKLFLKDRDPHEVLIFSFLFLIFLFIIVASLLHQGNPPTAFLIGLAVCVETISLFISAALQKMAAQGKIKQIVSQPLALMFGLFFALALIVTLDASAGIYFVATLVALTSVGLLLVKPYKNLPVHLGRDEIIGHHKELQLYKEPGIAKSYFAIIFFLAPTFLNLLLLTKKQLGADFTTLARFEGIVFLLLLGVELVFAKSLLMGSPSSLKDFLGSLSRKSEVRTEALGSVKLLAGSLSLLLFSSLSQFILPSQLIAVQILGLGLTLLLSRFAVSQRVSIE